MKVDDLREQVQNLYWTRSSRERMILITALGVAVFMVLYLVIQGVVSFYSDQKQYVSSLEESYLPAVENIERYKVLKTKLASVLAENENSQLDVAEASNAIDKVVKESVGDKDYRFDKDDKLEDLGFAGSKRSSTTLEFNSLSLEEIIKLIYNFDRPDTPIFIGNVEIFKNRSAPNTFKLRLEVFTILKVV